MKNNLRIRIRSGRKRINLLLYPRRLVPHRGFDIFMGMCEELLRKGYNIEPYSY